MALISMRQMLDHAAEFGYGNLAYRTCSPRMDLHFLPPASTCRLVILRGSSRTQNALK